LAKAEGTIYINADGSVDPSTASIQQDGNVYTLTDNIIEQKIVVERDNIIIDGADFNIQGNGAEVGIDITYRNNVTIKNIQIIGAGIHLVGANNNTIFRNLIASNHHGISFLGESNYNKIIGNTLMDNERGVYFHQSYNNSIYDNSFINNTKQVYDSIWEQPWYPHALSVNFWDNGTTGNYWGNYNGTDDNGDGVGDIPYVIDQNNQDNYPLMELYTIPENPPLLPLPYAPFNLFPEPDSIDIPLDTNISISISRPPSIVNMSISPEVEVKERIDEVIDYNGRYTFILSKLLEPNTTYSVTMVFGDKSAPEGFAPTSTKTWNFTTVAEAGTDFPIVEVTLAVSVIVVVFVVLYYSRRKLKL
jgi:parallel beta-helix repeat protein